MTFSQYWTQIQDLTLASVKARYRGTFAGFIWVLVNPLLQFGVQSLVFKKFLRLDIPNYHLFLLGGLLPWIFITSTVSMGTGIFVGQSHLLRSFKISPMVIISSQILDNFFNFLITVLIVLIPLYLYSDGHYLNVLAIPLAVIPLLITTSALTITLATLNVFYRDINFVVGFVFSIIFFLTPVFYPRSYVPDNLRWIIDYNFLVYIIDPFRALFLAPSWNEFFIAAGKGMLVSFCMLVIAWRTWKRRQIGFYYHL
jgi:ABC-type polysaccharide/polyol phosphate export permease